MGCLLFSLELLVDGIVEGWFFLMGWIIPEKYISRTFRIIFKVIIWIFSALLLFIMFLGICAIISDDVYTKQIGRYMVFIPLGISAIQILLGTIVRIILKNKK